MEIPVQLKSILAGAVPEGVPLPYKLFTQLTPVPVKGRDSGKPLTLFPILRVPVLEPAAVGVKVTLIAQLCALARGDMATQLSVSEKSPTVLTPGTLTKSPVALALVTVICCGALVVPKD